MKSTKTDVKRGDRPDPGAALGCGPLRLTVQYRVVDADLPTRPRVRRWVKAALSCAANVTVRFVGAAEARELNERYRGKGYATNVLSFPYEPPPRLAGDVIVCAPVVRDEALSQGKPLEARFAHLIVHGMLHLQGYEHDKDTDAMIMEQEERQILLTLGYPDPYGQGR